MRSTLDRQAFSLIFKPQSKCINILSTTARHNTALSSRFSSRSRCLTTNERNLNTLARQKPAIPRFQRNNRAAHFSTSSRRQATRVTLNPRVDEEGKPLTIEISQRAAERLREITDPSSSSVSTTLKENPYHHLRITVTSGGCHGFQYMMSLESASKIDEQEDTVFEADVEGETPTSVDNAEARAGSGARVVMDTPSLELLSGSKVDYTTELIGSQFKIVDNPRATSNCGCGTSFDVKD